MVKDEHGNPEPYVLPMSEKAWRVYGTWVMKSEEEDEHADIRLAGVYGKASGHVARLALVFEHLFWAADDFSEDLPGEVSVRAVKAAIRFREEYLRDMQRRVHDFASETSESSVARRIANHIIETRYEIVNASQLRRKSGIKGLNTHTLAETVDQAVNFLVEKRWLIPVEAERTPRGGGRRKTSRSIRGFGKSSGRGNDISPASAGFSLHPPWPSYLPRSPRGTSPLRPIS